MEWSVLVISVFDVMLWLIGVYYRSLDMEVITFYLQREPHRIQLLSVTSVFCINMCSEFIVHYILMFIKLTFVSRVKNNSIS